MKTSDSSRRSVWTMVAVLVLLPVLYVFGMGPAYGLLVFKWYSQSFVDFIYHPLWIVIDAVGISDLANKYNVWWYELFVPLYEFTSRI